MQVGRVLDLDRNYAQSYYVAGMVQLQAGPADSAIALLRHSIELGDPGPQGWAALASAYERTGNRGAALRMRPSAIKSEEWSGSSAGSGKRTC